MLKKFTLIILSLLFIGSAWGANKQIYIDSNAGDGGVGTIGDPYNNTNDIDAQDWIDLNAAATATDLAEINLKGTFSETLTVGASGASGYPITIQGYGTGVTISQGIEITSWTGPDGNGVYSASNTANRRYCVEDDVFIPKASDATCADGDWYVIVTDFYYKPAVGVPADHTFVIMDFDGILIDDKDYIEIKNIGFNYLEDGVRSINGSTNINVNNCTFDEVYASATSFWDGGSYNKFNYNTVNMVGNGVYFRAATTAYTHTNGEIIGNKFSYCNYNNISLADGHAVGTQHTKNTIVDRNTISFARAPIVFWTDSALYPISGNLITRNKVTDTINDLDISDTINDLITSAAINLQCPGINQTYNNIVSFNLIQRCSSGFCTKYGSSTGYNHFANNTITDCVMGVILRDGTDYCSIKNNIFNSNDVHQYWYSSTTLGSNNLSDYNWYYEDGTAKFSYLTYTPGHTFSEWQTDSSQDANSEVSDPLLRSDGKIYTGSPVLAKLDPGILIPGVNGTGTEDQWGNSGNDDEIAIGAYGGAGEVPNTIGVGVSFSRGINYSTGN